MCCLLCLVYWDPASLPFPKAFKVHTQLWSGLQSIWGSCEAVQAFPISCYMFWIPFYWCLSLATRTVLKNEDICKWGIIRPLLRGKQFMDCLPLISPVILRWIKEASNGKKEKDKEWEKNQKWEEVGAGEREQWQKRREKLSKDRGYCLLSLF